MYLLSQSVQSGHFTPEKTTIHKPLCMTSVLAIAEPTAGPGRAGITLPHSGGPVLNISAETRSAE